MSGCHELELRLDVENTRLDRTEQVRVLDFSFEPQILKCIFLIKVHSLSAVLFVTKLCIC